MEQKRYELGPTEVIDPALLEITTQQATWLLQASGCAFYLCDPATGCIELATAHNLPEISWAGDLPNQVVASNRAMVDMQTGRPAVLAVPATWRDVVRGVLVVVDETPGHVFEEHDATTIQPLADLTAAMLQQAEHLTRMTAQFRALHVIDIALSSSLELDRVLNLILEKAVDLVGAEHGSLRLLNAETGELVLKAFLGEGWTPEIRAYVFQLGQGITGWVAEHRQPYLCHDAHADPRNVVLFEEMRSGVAVPLLSGLDGQAEHEAFPPPPDRPPEHLCLQHTYPWPIGTGRRRQTTLPEGGRVMGVLLLESARPEAFGQQDVELLQALAQTAVIAIQNATRHQKLQLVYQALQVEQEHRVAAEKWTVMGQAATALAHRINNLIGIVPVSAGEVRRALAHLEIPPADRDWLDANLDRIERNSRFVLKLSDALFRPFQEPGSPTRFDVNRLLNQALQAANLSPEIEVSRDYEQSLPAVESSSLLVDIFLELVTNAGKAMAGQSCKKLEVRTRAETNEAGQWVVAQVSDTGVGISSDRMAHLWDMFQPSEGGLGFGLWWVRTFIERQGGTMSCESQQDRGTTFTVRLPAHPSGATHS